MHTRNGRARSWDFEAQNALQRKQDYETTFSQRVAANTARASLQ
ncbi:MAG: hypothetical protein U0T56_12565 [Ferruginibacter sp.]